jgi:4-amino-4-deoxy-L-arabinose transferase-like glycosyltransferase
MRFLKKNLFLIIILTVSLGVRIVGINYTLPLSTAVGDEIVITAGTLRMMAEKIPLLSFPHSNYFPLTYYIYIPFIIFYIFYLKFFSSYHTLEAIKELAVLHTGNFLMAGRMVSVLFGTFSVLLIYLISQNLFKNKKISLIASAIFALSPINVLMSHFARVWSGQIFFILLALYFILKFFAQKATDVGYGKIIMAGVFLGLAFMTNVIGILIYVPFLIVIFYSFDNDRVKNFLLFLKTRKFILLNFVVALFVAVSYFLNKTSFDLFLNAGFLDNFLRSQNLFRLSFAGRWFYYFKILLHYETALFLLGAIGFFLLYKHEKRIFWILLSGFLSFYLLIGPSLGIAQTRYSLPMIPFLVLPSAYLINFAGEKRGKKIVFSLLAVFLLPLAFLSVKMDGIFLRSSSELTAYHWIENNLPSNSRILLVNTYFLQDLIPTKEFISEVKKYAPEFFSFRMAYLLARPDANYPGPAYGIYQSSIICSWPKKKREEIKFDYVLFSEGILKEITSAGKIELCDNSISIDPKKWNLVYESLGETFFDSDYSHGKEDSALATLDYFSKIKKLGPKIFIYQKR